MIDVDVVAGFYSQLAGVLSGFAFVGMTLVVTRSRINSSPSGGSQESPLGGAAAESYQLVLLLGAFIGLACSSLSYALVAGMDGSSRAASVSHVVAGAGFSVSALALFESLHRLIGTAAGTFRGPIRVVVGLVIPGVLLAYVAAGAAYSAEHWQGVVLPAAALPVVAGLYLCVAIASLKWKRSAPRAGEYGGVRGGDCWPHCWRSCSRMDVA